MVSLLLLWFGISVPLVYLGYYFGYRKQPYQHPVRTNMIPRQVPSQQWYMNIVLRCVLYYLCGPVFNKKKCMIGLFQHPDGWHSAIWSSFYRTFLCVHGNMAKSILLPFRIFIFGILHFSG